MEERKGPALQVGATRDAVEALGQVVLRVIRTEPGLADQKTKRAALRTLASGLRVGNTTIQDCSFTMG